MYGAYLSPAVLTDFENILDESRRRLSGNTASSIVRACLVLSESDSNKPLLRGSNLLRLTADALRLFACNAPRLTSTDGDCGGGGSDPECAQLCVELLLQLSFCFSDQREWRSVVELQCADLQQMLLVVKDLPPARSLDIQTMLSVRHLLASLDKPAPSHVSIAPPKAAAARRHAMVSYCWGAKKELVVALAASLRAKGADVWRDEEGSQCVPAMSGSTDDCMAAAVEQSHTIIVCVSRAYKASANCRMEAKYANDMHKRGKVKLVFVMMEEDYTTRSSPEYVDGWLGLMIGDQLWHGMWADNQVAAVAAAIHITVGAVLPVAAAAAIPAAAHTSPRSPVAAAASAPTPAASPAATSPTQLFKPSATSLLSASSLQRPADSNMPLSRNAIMLPPASPTAASPNIPVASTSSPRPQPLTPVVSQVQSPSVPARSDDNLSAEMLTAAFGCLHDASKSLDSGALAALLGRLGVTSAADLAFVDDAATLSIKSLLKPVAANYFAVAIRYGPVAIAQALHAAKNECFAYLLDSTKHTDHAAMCGLLQDLGISQPHELQYLDESQLGSIVALFKPVAAKVFVHMISALRLQ
jgi:hypothetical protein